MMFNNQQSKQLLVCDRDERIIVYQYPQTYKIQSFCMKHSDMVNHLLPLLQNNIFISAGCDGLICFWMISNSNCKLLMDLYIGKQLVSNIFIKVL